MSVRVLASPPLSGVPDPVCEACVGPLSQAVHGSLSRRSSVEFCFSSLHMGFVDVAVALGPDIELDTHCPTYFLRCARCEWHLACIMSNASPLSPPASRVVLPSCASGAAAGAMLNLLVCLRVSCVAFVFPVSFPALHQLTTHHQANRPSSSPSHLPLTSP